MFSAQRCYLGPLYFFSNRERHWCAWPPLPLQHSVTFPDLAIQPLFCGEDLAAQDGITDVIQLAPFAMDGMI